MDTIVQDKIVDTIGCLVRRIGLVTYFSADAVYDVSSDVIPKDIGYEKFIAVKPDDILKLTQSCLNLAHTLVNIRGVK